MITFGQLLLAVSIPTIVAIIGILLNGSAVNSLRTEVRADITEMRSLFNHFVDRHVNNEGRITTLEERTKPKEGK
jgi:hypothetical protein